MLLLSTSTDWRKEFQSVLQHQWDFLVRGPLIRITALFRRRFFRTLQSHWVFKVIEWRRRLTVAIYSSSEDGFILFGVTIKQATALTPCQIFYKQRWLAYRPTLLMSPELHLRGKDYLYPGCTLSFNNLITHFSLKQYSKSSTLFQ